jgi:cell division protein FtsI (penicillin-binding protein 3)
VAGKTGTAKVANGNKGYADNIFQSSFAGYFPADNPQYTIIVNIKNKPNARLFYGASVAGPVFKEIADRLYVTYIQNKMDKAPSFNLKDSQLFNYTIAKTSLQAIAKQLSMPYQDSTPNNADWANVQGAGRALKAGQQLQMASDSTMPDISGMKLKDALWLCEKKGLIVKCSGKGKVVRQSILQGQYIQRGQQISIELN